MRKSTQKTLYLNPPSVPDASEDLGGKVRLVKMAKFEGLTVLPPDQPKPLIPRGGLDVMDYASFLEGLAKFMENNQHMAGVLNFLKAPKLDYAQANSLMILNGSKELQAVEKISASQISDLPASLPEKLVKRGTFDISMGQMAEYPKNNAVDAVNATQEDLVEFAGTVIQPGEYFEVINNTKLNGQGIDKVGQGPDGLGIVIQTEKAYLIPLVANPQNRDADWLISEDQDFYGLGRFREWTFKDDNGPGDASSTLGFRIGEGRKNSEGDGSYIVEKVAEAGHYGIYRFGTDITSGNVVRVYLSPKAMFVMSDFDRFFWLIRMESTATDYEFFTGLTGDTQNTANNRCGFFLEPGSGFWKTFSVTGTQASTADAINNANKITTSVARSTDWVALEMVQEESNHLSFYINNQFVGKHEGTLPQQTGPMLTYTYIKTLSAAADATARRYYRLDFDAFNLRPLNRF